MLGLIGKSVFLELKMANNARFLGEWFGEGVDILALQAFMHIDDEGDKRAKLKTTKFVRIPSDEKLQVNLKSHLSLPTNHTRHLKSVQQRKFITIV